MGVAAGQGRCRDSGMCCWQPGVCAAVPAPLSNDTTHLMLIRGRTLPW